VKTFIKYHNLLRFIIAIASLIFFTSIGFQDRLIQGWYQQTITNLNGSTIKDMTFVDSLTGFAVTSSNSLLQQYILRTTNGGDNWTINYTYNTPNSNWYFIRVIFLNSNTGYAFSWTEIFKTTNSGNNWNIINVDLYPEDIAILNKDTMLAVKSNSFNGGVYRTVNGGYNWENIWNIGSNGNPSKIYMFNKDIGFSCQPITSESRFRKTTDGGFTWSLINDTNFRDIKFADSLIGYKVFNNSIKKTTDGGITWTWQQYPRNFSFSGVRLSLINKDTVWFVGPTVYLNGFPYGVLGKTTNGGTNWGYQIPDTSIRISNLKFLFFLNKNFGWAYLDSNGVHTRVGGNDTTYYTGIGNHTSIISKEFELFQNYPNPFNSISKIKYKISKIADVKISVFDISGKEVTVLINKRHNAGLYDINFDGGGLPSGVYFYVLFVNSEKKDIRKMILIK